MEVDVNSGLIIVWVEVEDWRNEISKLDVVAIEGWHAWARFEV